MASYRYCGHYVEHAVVCDACLEEVPAIEVGNGEGWFAVGPPAERIETVPAQCEGCGGLIVLDDKRDRYVCGGYPEGMYDHADFHPEPPCATVYRIGHHVAYDTIF